jgi:DNA-binding GntR family transcriptional regulator
MVSSILPQLNTQHKTATTFAYDSLRRAILEGHLAPGTMLREQDLVEWLEVSRTPIREALRRLHTEGLVDATPYRSVTVREFDVEDIREEYVLRAALEGLAAEMAVKNLTDDDIVQLEEAASSLAECLDAQELDRYLEANHTFHFMLYRLSGSKRLVSTIDMSWKKLNLYRQFAFSQPQGWDEEQNFHQELLDACRRRDAGRARQIVQGSCFDTAKFIIQSLNRATDSA